MRCEVFHARCLPTPRSQSSRGVWATSSSDRAPTHSAYASLDHRRSSSNQSWWPKPLLGALLTPYETLVRESPLTRHWAAGATAEMPSSRSPTAHRTPFTKAKELASHIGFAAGTTGTAPDAQKTRTPRPPLNVQDGSTDGRRPSVQFITNVSEARLPSRSSSGSRAPQVPRLNRRMSSPPPPRYDAHEIPPDLTACNACHGLFRTRLGSLLDSPTSLG